MNDLGFGAFYSDLQGETHRDRIEQARHLGLTAVDIPFKTCARAEADLAAARGRRGLQVGAIIVELNDLNTGNASLSDAQAEIDLAIALSRRLGEPGIMLVDYFGPNKPGLLSLEDRRSLLKTIVRTNLSKLEGTSINFLVEHMEPSSRSTFPNYESAVAFVLEMDTPRARLVFDTFHLAAEKYPLMDVLRRYRELIAHVHLSDCNPDNEQNRRPLPGGGTIDFRPVIRFLISSGYSGACILEGAAWGRNGLADSLTHLRKLME